MCCSETAMTPTAQRRRGLEQVCPNPLIPSIFMGKLCITLAPLCCSLRSEVKPQRPLVDRSEKKAEITANSFDLPSRLRSSKPARWPLEGSRERGGPCGYFNSCSQRGNFRTLHIDQKKPDQIDPIDPKPCTRRPATSAGRPNVNPQPR